MIPIDCGPQIHLVAYHLQEVNTVSHEKYNNDTPGIGLICEVLPDVNLALGTYYNSDKRRTNYGYASWQPLRINSIRVGGMVGFATGYSLSGSTLPMVAGVFTYPVGRFDFNITAVPPIEGLGPGAAGLSVSYKFR